MASSLSTRLTKGLFANTFNQGVNLLIQLAAVPIFLIFWGAPLYGEWLILFAIPAYLALSDIGFATASTHQMAILVAADKKGEALSVFQSTWLFVFVVSLILLAIILAAVQFIPFLDWFNFSQIKSQEIRLVLLVLCLQVFGGLQTSMLHAGFNCDGQYGLGTFITALIRLFEFALLIFVVVAGGGPLEAASAYLAGRLLGYVAMRVVLRRRVPWLKSGFGEARLAILKELLRPSFAFMGFPLGNFFNLQGFVLLIGAISGPTAVVIFSTLRTLTRLVVQFVTAVNATIRPEISMAYGAEDFDLIRKLHRRSLQASIWIAALAIVLLALFGAAIVEKWTGGRVAMDYELFYLLLGTVFVNSLWWSSLNVLYGTNHHQGLAIVFSVTNALMLVIAYPLAISLGTPGAVAALLIIELILAVYTISKTFTFIQENGATVWLEVIKPPLFLIDQAKTLISKA